MPLQISTAKPAVSICVYCGSAVGNDTAYTAAARTLGEAMAAANIGLVYGGASIGLMGEIALSVLKNRGYVLGIIPEFLMAREVHLKDVTELIVTQDMHERKMLMFQRADAFIALPGGIGTLEELFEQLTWAQLGQHRKPIIIANIAGFWNPLIALMKQLELQGFLRKSVNGSDLAGAYHVVDEPADLVAKVLDTLPDQPLPARIAEIVRQF